MHSCIIQARKTAILAEKRLRPKNAKRPPKSFYQEEQIKLREGQTGYDKVAAVAEISAAWKIVKTDRHLYAKYRALADTDTARWERELKENKEAGVCPSQHNTQTEPRSTATATATATATSTSTATATATATATSTETGTRKRVSRSADRGSTKGKVQKPPDLVGKTFTKAFPGHGEFTGTVTSIHTNYGYWCWAVKCEGGDVEELNIGEMVGLKLMKMPSWHTPQTDSSDLQVGDCLELVMPGFEDGSELALSVVLDDVYDDGTVRVVHVGGADDGEVAEDNLDLSLETLGWKRTKKAP
jgi:hypothetical protein